jgi:hypothetical protein
MARADAHCVFVGKPKLTLRRALPVLRRAHLLLAVDDGALEREEAIYATAFVDAQSRPLNGAFAYRLNVPSGLPVSGFWSLSMYRSEADGRAFFVPNALNRFTVGDRTPGLAREPDGSLVISIQHTAPSSAEHRANWLPAPAGPFNLSWRLYEPGRPLLNRSVSLPGIERLA